MPDITAVFTASRTYRHCLHILTVGVHCLHTGKMKRKQLLKENPGRFYFIPEFKEEEIAKALYLEFAQRNRKDSVNKISKASAMPVKDASEVYAHIFEDKHLTVDKNGNLVQAYFDPNYEMSQSFSRIFNGTGIIKNDIIVLRHELYERKLMKSNPKMTYYEAHELSKEK